MALSGVTAERDGGEAAALTGREALGAFALASEGAAGATAAFEGQ